MNRKKIPRMPIVNNNVAIFLKFDAKIINRIITHNNSTKFILLKFKKEINVTNYQNHGPSEKRKIGSI